MTKSSISIILIFKITELLLSIFIFTKSDAVRYMYLIGRQKLNSNLSSHSK